MFQAVSKGDKDFAMLAVVGGPAGAAPKNFCPPCGVCRQVLMQFCPADMTVLTAIDEEQAERYTLEELLPHAWSRNS